MNAMTNKPTGAEQERLAEQIKSIQKVSIEQIELFADNLDVKKAGEIYREYGCLVVRGMTRPYIDAIARDIDAIHQETLAQQNEAQKVPEGWRTPNGGLLLPAPKGWARDKQIMLLPMSYRRSAAAFLSAIDSKVLDICETALGPNIELFMDGQCVFKEATGGHPKNLHQDSAYFEHKHQGPVACLNYVVETGLQNGALYVIPGSHRLGQLRHVDTFSHLGLPFDEWSWEHAVPVIGKPGDAIFFQVQTIHGSQPNHSDKPRPVMIHRYRAANDYTVIGATRVDNRKEAEAKATQASKATQQNYMVRGFRSWSDIASDQVAWNH